MSLTIVLPIHGRPEFVDRFLGLKLPYRTHLLTEPGFLDKIARGINKVTTPYVMLADCDDFPQPDGINDCISFLDNHSDDYVCASGLIEGIWLFPNKVRGPFRMRSRQYSVYDTPAVYDQDNANDRVLAGFRNSWSYYGVYRTEALQTIWREVAQYGFTDLMVHEKFCAMRTLTLGKVYGSMNTSLVRQYATSQVAVGRSDWRKTYNDGERRSVLAHMAKLGVDTAMLNYAWSEWYEERERSFYGHPVRKWLGRTFPFLRKLAPLLEMR